MYDWDIPEACRIPVDYEQKINVQDTQSTLPNLPEFLRKCSCSLDTVQTDVKWRTTYGSSAEKQQRKAILSRGLDVWFERLDRCRPPGRDSALVES